MQRRLVFSLAAAAACAACMPRGIPRTVVITEAQLQERLGALFPAQRRVLSVLDVQALQPRVHMLPDRNRIAAAMDIEASERLTRKQARGRLEADSALRYEPSDASLRLSQVRVSSFELSDGGTAWPGPARHAAAILAEQLLEDQIVWRASSTQADRLRRLGVQTVDIQVTARGIEITLGDAAG